MIARNAGQEGEVIVARLQGKPFTVGYGPAPAREGAAGVWGGACWIVVFFLGRVSLPSPSPGRWARDGLKRFSNLLPGNFPRCASQTPFHSRSHNTG